MARLQLLGFVVSLLFVGHHAVSRAEETPGFHKHFHFGAAASDATLVDANSVYSEEKGFGFEQSAKLKPVKYGAAECLESEGTCLFSCKAPEGNYRVTATLGGGEAISIKSELRRLSVEHLVIPARETKTVSFIVNVRTPKIENGKSVKLKTREKEGEWFAWDEKLTLEFNSPHCRLIDLTVQSVATPTLFILGDSTVCDQPHEPYASWGQMFPRFFEPTIAVANYAQSGESLRSSRNALRLAKVLGLAKPGDFAMIQFGHNDMKAISPEEYKKDLEQYVTALSEKGVSVILVTQVQRQSFKDGHLQNSHKDYPDQVRAVAKERSVPLIDLHAKSTTLYETLGPEGSSVLFKSGDKTHHNNYGAYELAHIIAAEVRELHLPLAKHLVNDMPAMDPAHPLPLASFQVPSSPSADMKKPDGD
jgi:lysophospholipase L1-like esterase